MEPEFLNYADGYLRRLREVLEGIAQEEVEGFVSQLLRARERESTIYFIGNGGSAATSAHFANDLAVGTRQLVKPFRVISLVDNVATLTALGNDYGYDQVFSRQVAVYGKENDLLVGISASGNSPNLVEAFDTAKTKSMTTIAITAFDGGRLREMADYSVHVPTSRGEYGPAEDAHMVLDHLITNYFCSIDLH